MESKEHIHQKIWDYLDGNLSGYEFEEIKQKIISDSEWKASFESASFLQKELLGQPPEQPSPDFSVNVMKRVHLNAKPKRNAISVEIVLASFFVLCIVFLIVKAAFSEEWSPEAQVFSPIGAMTSEEYTSVKNNVVCVLMAMNVVLMLVLADRLVRKTFKMS